MYTSYYRERFIPREFEESATYGQCIIRIVAHSINPPSYISAEADEHFFTAL